MKIGKACAIFADIQSDKHSDEEKGMAIYQVCRMETKNSITKAMMWRVIWWLLNMTFDLPKGDAYDKG